MIGKFGNNAFLRLEYFIDFENVIFRTMPFWENNICEQWHFEAMQFCMHLFHFADFFFRYTYIVSKPCKDFDLFCEKEISKTCLLLSSALRHIKTTRVKFSRESRSNLVRINRIHAIYPVIREISAVSVLFTVA